MLVVKRRANSSPRWLKAHQQRLAAATRQAALDTAHLHGHLRVTAMSLMIRRYMLGTEKHPWL